ncbi:hypothetical protein C8D89_102205 [Actinomycetospora cinnamomea]|uniref:Uncharacterized protein n=1 Tax=Actinomycetospora cinnamomea TaxID=663609 RepID=A0A2U1FLQ5_9PSEU|nr:hypothetical protein [Actinomycetospora cinnamomea]PVZ13056.1 hypothetical protein C8D89_102205 [Actinomycetospora cinnamomea]
MAHTRELEAARRRFLRHGRDAVAPGLVRRDVLASWERARAAGVDTGRLAVPAVGLDRGPRVVAAERVVDAVHARHPELDAAVLVVDRAGVVQVRRDGDAALAELLDAVHLVPGHRHAEDAVGTTAAGLALHEGCAVAVEGPEHLHPALGHLAAAAAPVDPADGGEDLAVVVVRHASDGAARDLPFVRELAREVAEQDRRHRRARVLAVHDALAGAAADGAVWTVATDGEEVLLGAGVRRLPAGDQQALADLAVAGLALGRAADPTHVDLSSGGCAEVALRDVRCDGALVGCILGAGPAVDERAWREAEARRRQGSHVAPTARRDFAADLRDEHGAAERSQAEARVRANRDLLTPSLRARQELVANLAQRRHQVLVGEAGVGKRTLAVEHFTRLQRDGTVTVLDGDPSEDGARTTEPLARLADRPPAHPHLVVLRGLQHLTPLSARRLDESLRLLLARSDTVVVVACLDTTSVDASRPYGLLLRHFHETVRVPALRHRADELGDLARARSCGCSRATRGRATSTSSRTCCATSWPASPSASCSRPTCPRCASPAVPRGCRCSRPPRPTRSSRRSTRRAATATGPRPCSASPARRSTARSTPSGSATSPDGPAAS